MDTLWPILRRIFIIGGVMMVAAMVAGFFVLRARRRTLEKARAAGPGFAVEELEALRAAGRISDEEFKKLRRAALGIGPAVGKDKPPPMTPQALAAAMDDRKDRRDEAVEQLDELAGPATEADDPEGQKRDNASSAPPEHDDETDNPATQ